MFLGNNTNLENKIVITLASRNSLQAEQMQQKITPQVTIQGVYRALHKLQTEGVLVKSGQTYSLRIPWLLDLGDLVETMEKTYLQANYFSFLLSTLEKKKRIWYFKNFLKMNNLWSQLLLAITKYSKSKIMLDFNPHIWFHLFQPYQEYQYIKAQLKLLKKEYTIIGSNLFLDKHATKYWNFDNLEYYLASSDSYWGRLDRSVYFSIFSDFILTAKFNKKSTERIEKFYIKVNNDSKLSNIIGLFDQPISAKIILEKNKNKAHSYYKRFEKTFGPLS